MTMVSITFDGYAQLVRELQAEFDGADVGAIADRIVASEAADFYWDARVCERYLGQDFSAGFAGEDGEDELARVACISLFARRWHVGIFVVNGEGQAVDLLARQVFNDRSEAEAAFLRAR